MSDFLKNNCIHLFTYLWLCWVLLPCGLFSSCCEQGLLSSYAASAAVHRRPIAGGRRAWGLELWCTGPAAPQHVGSSWIRGPAPVCCADGQVLYS